MSEGLDLSTERLKKKLDRIIARGSDDFRSKPSRTSKRRVWVLLLSGLLSAIILTALVLLLGKARKIPTPFQWSEASVFPIFSKLVATPFVSEDFIPSGKAIGVADMGGTFHLFDAANSKKSFQFTTDSSVVASPFALEVNGKTGVLILSRKGTLTFLSRTGSPYWTVEPQLLAGEAGSEFLAKPLLVKKGGVSKLFLTDGLGRVYAISAESGQLLWVNRDSPLNAAAVFAPAIGNHKGTIFLAGVSGTVVALDTKDGRCLWSQKLPAGIKAGLVLAPFLSTASSSLALVCLNGSVHILDPETGAVQKSVSVKDAAIATPVAFQTSFFSKAQLAVSTLSGNVHLFNFLSDESVSIFPAGALHPFRATPFLCDLNRDGIPDLIALSGAGSVFLLNGKDLHSLAPPYSLGGEVTASPVLFDLRSDGRFQLVAGLEGGIVKVLNLTPVPDTRFLPFDMNRAEFLGESENNPYSPAGFLSLFTR